MRHALPKGSAKPYSSPSRNGGQLEAIRKSHTEEKRRTLRAAILLDSQAGQSDEMIARHHHISRGTVVLCIQKCQQFGLEAALGELSRPGKPRQLPDDAMAWVRHCACQKPKELGYSYELWTYKLLTTHVRQHCAAAGHPALQKLSRSKLHKILSEGDLRPHKIRYYVERRDPAFEAKMANVLHVYKEVEIVHDGLLRGTVRELGMTTVSYDEKPGIQALAVTTPDRPPVAGRHPSHLRDYEYERLGTVSLLAGLDLHSGRVIETISDTHTSADFIDFLKKLEDTYPAHQKIRLVLDNHSAHISKQTRSYLETVPHRFVFVFTPTHGSWLNLIESQFSKMTRTMLRGIRAASKEELIQRIHQYFNEINADPVVFRWKYKMDEPILYRYYWLSYLPGISATQLNFSDDGKWLSYVSFPGGALWRSDAQGGNRLQLTSPPLQVGSARWSPDGKQIAFDGAPPGEAQRVFVLPVTGGAARQLTSGESGEIGDIDPSWSPDGASLVFSSSPLIAVDMPDKILLRIVDIKTGRISTLAGSQGLWSPRYSPMGHYIAALELPSHHLVLYDVETNERTDLTPRLTGDSPCWSRDGEFVYFEYNYQGGNGSTEIYRVRVRDRKLERLANLQGVRFPQATGEWFGLAPDDSRLSIRDRGGTDIYALDWDAP